MTFGGGPSGPPYPLAVLRPTDRLVSLSAILLCDAATGAPPRLRTSVRTGLREGALLVRFDGRDEGWIATRTRRDDELWKEDVFEVFLTPQNPPHVYYEFEVNPLGALFDARIESPRLRRPMTCVDVAWDCPGLRARVRLRPTSWSALLTIPLAPLAPEGVPSLWRANFFRVDRGLGNGPDEYSAWSPVGAPPDFHRADRFGTLRLPGESGVLGRSEVSGA